MTYGRKEVTDNDMYLVSVGTKYLYDRLSTSFLPEHVLIDSYIKNHIWILGIIEQYSDEKFNQHHYSYYDYLYKAGISDISRLWVPYDAKVFSELVLHGRSTSEYGGFGVWFTVGGMFKYYSAINKLSRLPQDEFNMIRLQFLSLYLKDGCFRNE